MSVQQVIAHGGTGEWIVDIAITLGIAAVGIAVWLRGRGGAGDDEPGNGPADRWWEDE